MALWNVLYPYTRVANESGFELEDFPALDRWLERVEAQPGFIPMLAQGADETLGFADYPHYHPAISFSPHP